MYDSRLDAHPLSFTIERYCQTRTHTKDSRSSRAVWINVSSLWSSASTRLVDMKGKVPYEKVRGRWWSNKGDVHWDVLEEQPAGLVDDVGKEAMLVMPSEAATQGRQEYVLAEAGEEVVR